MPSIFQLHNMIINVHFLLRDKSVSHFLGIITYNWAEDLVALNLFTINKNFSRLRIFEKFKNYEVVPENMPD